MITNSLAVEIKNTPEEAPNYGDDYKLIKAHTAIIVCNGTVKGNPTVDLQLTDKDGNKYIVMASAFVIEALNSAICGARKLSELNNKVH